MNPFEEEAKKTLEVTLEVLHLERELLENEIIDLKIELIKLENEIEQEENQ